VEHLPREAFYAAVKSDRTLLVIASGEQRRFANLLLTVAPGG
ncbi:RbsD/FucU domain-containing protein, partial [Klebsiella variicola]